MRLLTTLCLLAAPAWAEPPVIEAVTITPTASACRVAVTMSHPDTGWLHYADAWRIEDAEGRVLGTRLLAHPHETEQPFTRCLAGVVLPEGAEEVFIRAKCSVDGWNEWVTRVPVPEQ
jgi:hypothetical protein